MLDLRELKQKKDLPIVISNRKGIVNYVNDCFLETFKWDNDLIGSSLTRIIPSHYHDSHNMGFSRFIITGHSKIAHHLIEAQVIMGNGNLCKSHHLIVVEKIEGDVMIGAVLTPIDYDSSSPSPSQAKLSYRQSQTIDELRGTMGKMELALTEVADAIVWTNQEGRICWCNESFDKLTEHDHLSILGEDFLKLIQVSSGTEEDNSSLVDFNRFLDYCKTRSEFNVYLRGEKEILEIRSSDFHIDHQYRSIVLVIRVITEQREIQDAVDASRKRMERELEFGREIQMGLLPPPLPGQTEFSLHADTQPALEVGGDFYDYFYLNSSLICFCIGDVAGKGVAAAILAAVTQTIVKNHCYASHDPSEIIAHANREICERNRANMFVSLILAILDIESGELTYTNAGHNIPFLRRTDHSVTAMCHKHGPVLGIEPDVSYGKSVVKMACGDAILAYTDGATEAVDDKGRFYSQERLEKTMRNSNWVTPQQVTSSIKNDIARFVGAAGQADDITLFCLIFYGKQMDYHI